MSAGICLRARTSAIDLAVLVGAAKRVAGARASMRDKVFVKIILPDSVLILILVDGDYTGKSFRRGCN